MGQVFRTVAAALYVALSPATLEKMRTRGDGPPYVRLGRRAVGYRVEDLDSWLVQRKSRSGKPQGDA